MPVGENLYKIRCLTPSYTISKQPRPRLAIQKMFLNIIFGFFGNDLVPSNPSKKEMIIYKTAKSASYFPNSQCLYIGYINQEIRIFAPQGRKFWGISRYFRQPAPKLSTYM